MQLFKVKHDSCYKMSLPTLEGGQQRSKIEGEHVLMGGSVICDDTHSGCKWCNSGDGLKGDNIFDGVCVVLWIGQVRVEL